MSEDFEVDTNAVACDAPPRADAEPVESAVAALASVTHAELRFEWRRHFRTHPPKKLSRELLELGVAWKLQERVLGGLSPASRRQLDELARTLETNSDLTRTRRHSLKPGARLVRDWGGETHEVLVVEDGFVWRGKTWASLSAIARAMTGTRWSGPRFFGLDKASTAGATAEAEGLGHE